MSYLTEEVKTMIFQHNRNVIIIITGEPGSGKSFIALRLGELFDPRFFKRPFEDGTIKTIEEAREHLKKRIKFDPEDFLELLAMKEKELYRGSVVILEEAGLQFGADDFQKFITKTIIKIFQIFRFKNLITILTVPDLNYIAKKARTRVQFHIQAFKYTTLPDGKTANITKTHRIQWNEQREQFYRRRLLFGGTYLQPYYFKRHTSDLLIRAYESFGKAEKQEAIVASYQDVRLRNIKQRQIEKARTTAKLSTDQIVERILKDDRLKPYKVGGVWYINYDAIRFYYGLGATEAKMVRVKAQGKIREDKQKEQADSKKTSITKMEEALEGM